MIQEQYQEDVLLAKHLLSSEANFFTESHAPLIGYPMPFHGTLMPIGFGVIPCSKSAHTELGKTLMNDIYIYKEKSVLINSEGETMKVYAREGMPDTDVERVLEVWSRRFYGEL